MNEYTPLQMKYIASVDGAAHLSAVKIIGEAEAEIEVLRKALSAIGNRICGEHNLPPDKVV